MGQTRKKMGPVMLTALVACNMMGSGVFLLPANLARIGSISIFGWLITSIAATALAFIFSRLSLLYPRAGGPYAYAKAGFGDYAGFQTVYSYWIASWVGNVALAVACIGYLSFFFPPLNNPITAFIVSIAILWLLTIMNFFGARTLGRILASASIIMLLPLLGAAIFGWFWFKPTLFHEAFNVSHQSNFNAITQAASLTLWAFIGVESAAVSAGVTENPRRNIPLATTLGTFIAAIVYMSSSLVIMGIVPNDQLATASAPFSLAASLILGPVAGKLVAICAAVACLASLSGWILLVGQASKAAADDQLFPKLFSRTNRFDVPVVGLVIAAILMSVLLLLTISPRLSEQFQTIIAIAVFMTLLPYLYSAVALGILSYRHRVSKGLFRVCVIVGIIACLYIFWAMLGSGNKIIAYSSLMILISIPLYAWTLWERHRHTTTKKSSEYSHESQ